MLATHCCSFEISSLLVVKRKVGRRKSWLFVILVLLIPELEILVSFLFPHTRRGKKSYGCIFRFPKHPYTMRKLHTFRISYDKCVVEINLAQLSLSVKLSL